MGVMRQDDDGVRYFNSVLALGGNSKPAFYDKTHLVPFGEYFPVPHWVREWLRLMSLPHSDFNAGANDQPPLAVAGMKIAASICYEDSYPTSLHAATRESGLLVNVTNDAWFGRSGARYQHLQIARLRAIEGRRFLVRAANDGVSAIIGPSGAVVAQAPEFTQAVLRGRIQPRHGTTPYLVTGNYPVIGARRRPPCDNGPGPLDTAPPEYHFTALSPRKVHAGSRNLRAGGPVYSMPPKGGIQAALRM